MMTEGMDIFEVMQRVDPAQPIDWLNPINRDLVFCFDGERDLVGSTRCVRNGNAMRVGDALFGQALRLGGGSDSVRANSHPAQSGMAQLTLAAWVFKADEDIKPFGKWGAGGSAFILRENGGELQAYVFTSGQVGGGTGVYPETGWHLYSMVYDGANILIYVDGELATTPYSVSGAIQQSTDPLYLGAEYDGTASQDGRVAWSRIWRRGLSASENRELFAQQTRLQFLRVKDSPSWMYAFPWDAPEPPEPTTAPYYFANYILRRAR